MPAKKPKKAKAKQDKNPRRKAKPEVMEVLVEGAEFWHGTARMFKTKVLGKYVLVFESTYREDVEIVDEEDDD